MNIGMSPREEWILAHDPAYRRFTMTRISEARTDFDGWEPIHATDGTRHCLVMQDKFGSWERIELLSDSHYRGIPLQHVQPEELDAMLGVAEREGWLAQ